MSVPMTWKIVTVADSRQSGTVASSCAANPSSPKIPTHLTWLPPSVSPANLYSQFHGLNLGSGSNSNSDFSASQNVKLETQPIHPASTVSAQSSAQLQSMSHEFGATVGSNVSVTTSGMTPGGLPEQRIFPGIMHERAMKGSMMTGSTTGEGRNIHEQGKDDECGESEELVHKDVVDEDDD